MNKLNETLIQVPNCKEIAKWLIKTILLCLKKDLDGAKLAKYYLSIGLNEAKAVILKDLVIILKKILKRIS